MSLAHVVVVMLVTSATGCNMALWDIGSSVEIDGGMCCVGSVLMTPFLGCIETAVPVRNSGNGMWGAAKIS